MSYRQYTKCVSPDQHTGSPVAEGLVLGLFTGLIAGLAAGVWGIGVLVGILAFVITFCDWWLYNRLVCLGGDRGAIGMLISVEPPPTSIFDTDYSVNIVLAPHIKGATQAEIENDGKQGNLIRKQQPVIDYGWDWGGYSSKQYENEVDTAVLHCEFEGAGVYILYEACKVALPLAIAATAAFVASVAFCWIPIIGWIACAVGATIAWILATAAIATALGGVIAGAADRARPTDVDATLGELHTNDFTGFGADLLFIKGEWVYDSFHSGWNEIHPVRHCQRIGRWAGQWEWDITSEVDHWDEAVGGASSPLTVANQAQPENQWSIHPVIDGCRPRGVPGMPLERG